MFICPYAKGLYFCYAKALEQVDTNSIVFYLYMQIGYNHYRRNQKNNAITTLHFRVIWPLKFICFGNNLAGEDAVPAGAVVPAGGAVLPAGAVPRDNFPPCLYLTLCQILFPAFSFNCPSTCSLSLLLTVHVIVGPLLAERRIK